MGNTDSDSDLAARRDQETGKFTEKYPPTAFITAINEERGEAGTKAIAKRVGCSYETAYKKLQTLKKAGEIGSKQVGNAHLWRLEDE